MEFDNLTYAPIDKSLIVKELLSKKKYYGLTDTIKKFIKLSKNIWTKGIRFLKNLVQIFKNLYHSFSE